MANLLAPAGDLEKLEYAVRYGADEVYLGLEQFGMRANAGNFSMRDLEKGIAFAHERNVKVNVTMNILARNYDIKMMIEKAKRLYEMGVDALIVADPGVIYNIKNEIPDMFLSLSTQMSTTNMESLKFWKKNGVSRVVLARELSFDDIREICQNKPDGMQVEIFVHGAMCISYSGRCLLSNYLVGRDANRGDCAQPCRWQYSLMEKTREGQYFDIEENKNGSFFFNSKDLCLIEHIPELIDIGVDSFKVEGRMKSIFYVATVISAYREAINRACSGKQYLWKDLYEELTKVSHRQYTQAFFDHRADETSQNYGTSSYTRNYDFSAVVLEDTDENGLTKIEQRNKFQLGDTLERIHPGAEFKTFTVDKLYDMHMEERYDTPHPKEELYMKSDVKLFRHDLLRKKSIQ